MFSLSELAPLNQHQSRFKLLKPWWEVFMDYLVVLMLMTSVLACTEQLSRDRVVCIPLNPLVAANSSERNPSSGEDAALSPSSKPPTHVPPNIQNLHTTARGRRTHLVYQQYVYISQVICTSLSCLCHWNNAKERLKLSKTLSVKSLKAAIIIFFILTIDHICRIVSPDSPQLYRALEQLLSDHFGLLAFNLTVLVHFCGSRHVL